ncbi:MAG: multidrug effflux MFS transporter [Rhodobacteraceae bacterium]|jgi:DHA1 family bicyclomycin/chloramphenicol resistance-like MFS transporter|nr:multidrug effflux MFS transporter [Paracoccaceae bacterium]
MASPEIPLTARPAVRFLDRATPPHTATLILIAGLSAASMNIMLPSLPAMTAYFDTDYALMQLSVAIYLGVNAVLQIIVGPLSDRFGRRPVILGGCVIFLIATVGCLLAPTVEVFLAFRMMQAVIVTGMVLSRAVVRDMVPQDQAASMIGYVTMGMTLVPMISPALGGVLDDAFGWHSVFILLFVCGLGVTWLVWRDLGETAAKSQSSLMGQVRQYPQLLTARRFWGYCLASAFASGAFFAYLGGAPFVGSVVFGLTPSVLGIVFGAPAVGYLFGNFLSARYAMRVGINPLILAGCLVTLGGLSVQLLLFLAGYGNVWVFFAFMTFVGFGNGLVMPNATAGMLSVRPHLAGTASGLGGAIMIGGGAALSALAGFLLTPERGALPLIWIMVATSACGLVAILYVLRRERQLARG